MKPNKVFSVYKTDDDIIESANRMNELAEQSRSDALDKQKNAEANGNNDVANAGNKTSAYASGNPSGVSSGNAAEEKTSAFDPNDPKIKNNDIVLPDIIKRTVGKSRLTYEGAGDKSQEEGADKVENKGVNAPKSWYDTLMDEYRNSNERYNDLLKQDDEMKKAESKRQNIANVFSGLASLANSIGVATGGSNAGANDISSKVMRSIQNDQQLRRGNLREALENNQRALNNLNRRVEFEAEMERKKALDDYAKNKDADALQAKLTDIENRRKYYEDKLKETQRHNEAMETIQKENEGGRNSRNDANNTTRKEIAGMREQGQTSRNSENNATRKEIAEMREKGQNERSKASNTTRKEIAKMRGSSTPANAEERKKKDTAKRLANHSKNFINSRALIEEYDNTMRRTNPNYISPFAEKGSYYILTEQDIYQMFNNSPEFANKYLSDQPDEVLIDIDAEFNKRGGSKKIDEMYND